MTPPISTTLAEWDQKAAPSSDSLWSELAEELSDTFGSDFHLCSPDGELLRVAEGLPTGDSLLVSSLVPTVIERRSPEILEEDGSALLLALPIDLPLGPHASVVAVAPFVVQRPIGTADETASTARLLGTSLEEADAFANSQPLWPPHALLRLARSFLKSRRESRSVVRLADEVDKLSQNLTSTYEEISLLYGVTQNLKISSRDEELGRLALEWLSDCLPAEGVAIQFVPVSDERETYEARANSTLLTQGDCPIESGDFSQLVQDLQLSATCSPLVLNEIVTSQSDWSYPGIRQLIVVPLSEGANLFGWLAAFNHVDSFEFGTVEASLLNSVGAILGIHSGNRELYRQQAEFLASVVQALTSAIDAKDPYTCGHSDRVARFSVRLAQQLGCPAEQLNTMYMAGLLHDIGKIGIDDRVLRKPDRLTDEEFEHIKLHPELGHKILCDIKQLSDVLPVVLHHHEQWDGKGYPHKLKGEETPFLARIAAVADAFDAMTSDRPYRKGMPVEKVENIFRGGAGEQWDPAVINAFFEARSDIIEIMRRERANLSLDVKTWVGQMGGLPASSD